MSMAFNQMAQRVEEREQAMAKINRQLNEQIEERKLTEEKLKVNEEKLSLIMKTIPEGMDVVDEELNILWMNDKFLGIFGEDAIGKKCYHLYKDNKKQCENCHLYSA